jgi:hypothetical protein
LEPSDSADARKGFVEVALIFRTFALEHPALFAIAFDHADPAISPRFRSARLDALAVLHKRFEPLADADLLGGRSVPEAATQFGPGRRTRLDRPSLQPTPAQPGAVLAQRLPRPHHRLRRSRSPPPAAHEPCARSDSRSLTRQLGVEPLWSPTGATDGNRWRDAQNRKAPETGQIHLP